MKLLAFTDLHGSKKSTDLIIKKAKKENPDFLVCTGDISNWGKNVKDIISKFKDLEIPLLIISGNHEDGIALEEISKKFNFVICLDGGSYELEDYVFFGYGGGAFSKKDKDFERISKKFEKVLNKKKKFILLVHAPPYGTKLDDLPLLGHSGNNSIRKFIEKNNPSLVICGHLHENFNVIDKIKTSVVVNPGPDGKMIKI